MKTTGRSPRAVYDEILGAFERPSLSFAEAVQDPHEAQRRVLARLGKTLGLGTVDDLDRWRAAAPLSSYADMASQLDAVWRGTRDRVHGQQVQWFEQSGGTGGHRKVLPITAAYRRELGAGLAPWLYDLFALTPGLTQGRAYWAISPSSRRMTKTPSGLPVGAPTDAAYFPSPLDERFGELLAVGPEVAATECLVECRRRTARALLRATDLTFISVWSPTFLTLLLDQAQSEVASLTEDIARGNGGLADPARARQLRRAFLSSSPWPRVWPQLRVISMWTDAGSARFVPDVARQLPGVHIQGKGLLATEGIVSLPLRKAPAPVLAVQSHLYEFLPDDRPGGDDDEEATLFAHQLEQGATYRVVLTTGAGLIRYRLGDRVRVEGFYRSTPCLRFVGRAGQVSDLVGEKLSADDVERALSSCGGLADASFVMMAPCGDRGAPRYQLFVQSPAPADALEQWTRQLDEELKGAHPYDHARRLGQLGPIEPVVVEHGLDAYVRRCLEAGQRAGDIKPQLLRTETNWASAFARPARTP